MFETNENDEEIDLTEKENAQLKAEVEDLKNQLASLQSK